MGIQIETTIYGEQIARELVNNPEELACALIAMFVCDVADLGAEVAACTWRGAEIAAFLRSMADAIDAGGGDEL